MFQTLEILQTSMSMARHAGRRQAVTAANLANADTPGYRARSIAPFSESYSAEPHGQIRRTRAEHLSLPRAGTEARVTFADGEASPNGNTVSLEQEMLTSVEIQREHNRALAIYKHTLDVLRISIGRK